VDALAITHIGGEFGAEYIIFGYIWVIYIYLGCFGAQREAEEGTMEFAMHFKSLGS